MALDLEVESVEGGTDRPTPSPPLFRHPLMGAQFGTLLKAWRSYGGASLRFTPHAAALFGSALARLPFRILERWLEGGEVDGEARLEAPVFIVGYWRSGTTHLHNLVGSCPDFGIITPLASGLPGELLTLGTWLEPLLERALPEDRGVDDVEVNPRSPQEDEIPVANLQLLSVFHALYFPRQFRRNFERGVLLSGVEDEAVERWKTSVRFFLRKVAAHQERQPLVVKNPVYTARIDLLREMWPDARFIHIYRNPYVVYRSALRYFREMLSKLALQPYEPDLVEPVVLDSYPRMLDRLYGAVEDLPSHQFAEVRFERLEDSPLEELERLFEQLELPDWSRGRAGARQYLRRVADYTKNTYRYDSEVRSKVDRAWGRFVDRWGYDFPG